MDEKQKDRIRKIADDWIDDSYSTLLTTTDIMVKVGEAPDKIAELLKREYPQFFREAKDACLEYSAVDEAAMEDEEPYLTYKIRQSLTQHE